ncbi:MAG: hypothetical protein Q4C06_07510 [Bacillota bacterium]|nr:hypothetical protein [Bacillota bacterium]
MSSIPESNLYTLARTLQEAHPLEDTLARLFGGLQEAVEKDYLQKIHLAADAEEAFAVEHPPREVTLLRALSAYADENGRQQIERMSRSLLFLHSLQHIEQHVAALSAPPQLEARSIEGEAPPSAHSARTAGLLLALALAERF